MPPRLSSITPTIFLPHCWQFGIFLRSCSAFWRHPWQYPPWLQGRLNHVADFSLHRQHWTSCEASRHWTSCGDSRRRACQTCQAAAAPTPITKPILVNGLFSLHLRFPSICEMIDLDQIFYSIHIWTKILNFEHSTLQELGMGSEFTLSDGFHSLDIYYLQQ